MTTRPFDTSNTPRLDGATVVIVGGASGIAVELARQAVAAGAHVPMAGRHLDRTRAATQLVGSTITGTTLHVLIWCSATSHARATTFLEARHVAAHLQHTRLQQLQAVPVAAFTRRDERRPTTRPR